MRKTWKTMAVGAEAVVGLVGTAVRKAFALAFGMALIASAFSVIPARQLG